MKAMMMAAGLLASAMGGGAPADPVPPGADAATQALMQCIRLKTSGADRLLTARWILAALGSAPQVQGVVTVVPGRKEALDKEMAVLFTRLLTVDCLTSARAVEATRTSAGFTAAGQALGQIAVQELLTDPQANAAVGDFAKYLNQDDFKTLVAH